MAKDRRFEMRMASDLLDRVDDARGEVPRAEWICLTLERALSPKTSSGPLTVSEPSRTRRTPSTAAPTRTPATAQAEAVREELRRIKAMKGLSTAERMTLENDAKYGKGNW